jgi:hypothetical protein
VETRVTLAIAALDHVVLHEEGATWEVVSMDT